MTNASVQGNEVGNNYSFEQVSQSYVSMDEINKKKNMHRKEFLKTVHK
jgi:hypothetical protein